MKSIYITLTMALLLVLNASSAHKQGVGNEKNYAAIKKEALTVLQENCNTCHRNMNPSKVFSSDNMEAFAPLIEKEALIKKRMPLGFWNKLEDQELETLQLWVDELKTQRK